MPQIMKKKKHKKARNLRPGWDREARELRLGDVRILALTRSAPDEQHLLDVFQEDNWARKVDNPFGAPTAKQAHEKLRNVVKKLNRKGSCIRFHLDGTGEAVTWELLEDATNPDRTQGGT
jgi:hypothetical protein